MKIQFTIPGQPVGKARHRSAPLMRGGKPVVARETGRPVIVNYAPETAVAYEKTVGKAGLAAMVGRPPLQGPLGVNLFIGVQIPQSWSQKKQRAALAGELLPTTKPDKDNVIKAVYDGLNGVVWVDDVQIVNGMQVKRYVATPCVSVEAPLLVRPGQLLPLGGVIFRICEVRA
jgi:Holliday junction resolvase RusA-like endonuclease